LEYTQRNQGFDVAAFNHLSDYGLSALAPTRRGTLSTEAVFTFPHSDPLALADHLECFLL
jgi:hypothetical protein